MEAKDKSQQDILIQVENLSKKFCKDLRKSLWYGVSDLISDLIGIKKHQNLRNAEFWAVRDVSFQVRKGECVGLIGYNGAGKSTILKMLNGLILPDQGKISLKGNVGALIELGAGFNPLLTGRENVFNYGVILGFTHQEILEMYPAIVDFAEIKNFMETPVQNYSSGMKARLGFAVASRMNPDILIIDEVLAVGDIGFKKKCFDRIAEIVSNTAVIIVSHSIPQILRLCNRVIVMHKGAIDIDTKNISEGVECYYKHVGSNVSASFGDKLILHEINFQNRNVFNSRMIAEFDNPLDFDLVFQFRKPIDIYQIGILFVDKNQNLIATVETIKTKTNGKKNITHNFSIPKPSFGTRIMSLNIDFYEINSDGSRARIHEQQYACNLEVFNIPFTTRAPIILPLNEKSSSF